MKRVPEEQTTRARALRNNATKAECRLWNLISRYRPKFTRQLPVGPFIVDLACREARLIVEVDGGQHAECKADERRDAFLLQQGWQVVRVWNSDVFENPEGVVTHIMAEAAKRLGGTHPQPLPFREGSRVRQSRRISSLNEPLA